MGSRYRLPKSFHIHINNRIPEFTLPALQALNQRSRTPWKRKHDSESAPYNKIKSSEKHIHKRIPTFTNTLAHFHIPTFFNAFFTAITHHLKINALHQPSTYNSNFLIFNTQPNHPFGNLSAFLRRSRGNHFITALFF